MRNQRSDREEPGIRVYLATPVPPPYGGITNWSRIVEKALNDDSRIDCRLIDISLKKEANERGVLSNAKGLMRILKTAVAEFSNEKSQVDIPQIVHICSSGGKGFLRDLFLIQAAHRRSLPVVIHFHFGRVPDLLGNGSLESRLLVKVVEDADGLMAMDESTYSALSRRGCQNKSYLVPNPIEIPRVDIGNCRAADQVVFVGHVNEQKGIIDLCKAWNGSKAKESGTVLKIVGPASPLFVESLARDYCLEGICFAGPMNHESALSEIASSRCLVLPSYTEGFPNVVLEAFAMGTPVVASTVGALPEMLSNGAGVMVEPGDVGGLRASIDAVLFDEGLSSRCVSSGRQKVMNQYSIDAVKERLLNCWNIVSTNRKGVEDN